MQERAGDSLFDQVIKSPDILIQGVLSAGECNADTPVLVSKLRETVDGSQRRLEAHFISRKNLRYPGANPEFGSASNFSNLDELLLDPHQFGDQKLEDLDPDQLCEWISTTSTVGLEGGSRTSSGLWS